MKRLASLGSWRRLGIQAGLLGGLGLAFVGGTEKPVLAGDDCPQEAECTFKKPNFLILLDYSSSMDEIFEPGTTRWEAAVEAIDNIITTDNGFFDEAMHIALMRFGHDPIPNDGSPVTEGTTIAFDPGAATGFPLIDGQSLDVGWYDVDNPGNGYYECNGQEIIDHLEALGAPTTCSTTTACIGTWTNGGMLASQAYIEQTHMDFPSDLDVGDERFYAILLVTDGVWYDVDGTGNAGEPPSQDPANTAADLYNNLDVPTYVVALGDAVGDGFADDVAIAGGTVAAIEAGAGELEEALEEVVDDIEQQVIIPECTSGLPRVMVILDASSSMLNVDGAAGDEDETGWDQARDALAGSTSIFDVQIMGLNNNPVEDLVHLGLLTFGSESPPEEEILVDYGPCMKDNFAWALDPDTSCGAGCGDPWGGPPIIWTFVGPGDAAYPGFDQDTYSRMPQCSLGTTAGICTGSATFTHRGIELAASNMTSYIASPPPLYPADTNTVYINILITDGLYTMYSLDSQVEAAMSDLYNNLNSQTYVIGFGDDLSDAQLDNMACWGSGGAGVPCAGGTESDAFDATTQDELETALETIIESLNFDPCCAFNDCSFNPEPTTGEPDPMTSDDGGSSSDSGGDTMGLTSGRTSGAGSSGGVVDDTSDDNAEDDSNDNGMEDEGDGPVTTMPATTLPADGGESGDESSGDGGATDPGGCGCTTDEPAPKGWMFGLLGLALMGVRRRKNR